MNGGWLVGGKHSPLTPTVLLVCVALVYGDPAAGVYSARQQYVPTARVSVLVVLSEVAEPARPSGFVAPTLVPPAEQSPPLAVTVAGPHRMKSTVPVGMPSTWMPVTVTVSDATVPGTTVEVLGEDWVDMVGVGGTIGSTVKVAVTVWGRDPSPSFTWQSTSTIRSPTAL